VHLPHQIIPGPLQIQQSREPHIVREVHRPGFERDDFHTGRYLSPSVELQKTRDFIVADMPQFVFSTPLHVLVQRA